MLLLEGRSNLLWWYKVYYKILNLRMLTYSGIPRISEGPVKKQPIVSIPNANARQTLFSILFETKPAIGHEII